MDQKDAKIIVLFMTMLFCLEFVQARPNLQDAMENLVELSQELKTGSCTTQRYSELTQAMQQCIQQQQAKLQRSVGPNICSILGPILQCMDPLDECYTIQELNRYKGATLQVTAEGIKLADKATAAKFKNCQQYKDLAGKGSIAGINMGILIALFIIVAFLASD